MSRRTTRDSTLDLAVIVAASTNDVIGRDGELPWHLPDDLKRFKRLTLDHPVVMGRRTFESIGRPLPRRRNLVLSSRPAYAPDGVEVFPSLERAIDAAAPAGGTLFVLGGSRVFAEALPRARVLHLTRVLAEVEGDVVLPPIDWSAWHRVEAVEHPADARHEHPFVFETYRRNAP